MAAPAGIIAQGNCQGNTKVRPASSVSQATGARLQGMPGLVSPLAAAGSVHDLDHIRGSLVGSFRAFVGRRFRTPPGVLARAAPCLPGVAVVRAPVSLLSDLADRDAGAAAGI